jgi:triacylglycerol lipase
MAAAPVQRVYLVPGFFGFTNLGELLYFMHMKELLLEQLRALKVDAAIHTVNTLPTASIRRRAAAILDTIAETAGDDDGIHLVGHSTGGLDARLLCTPNVSLDSIRDVESYARRIRSVVTVSTPHQGTPLASFFSGLIGQKLLRLLSISTVYSLRFGRLPLSYLLRLGRLVSVLDNPLGWSGNVLDQLYAQLLDDFTPERRDALSDFFHRVGEDQSLIGQLTPEGIDLFNAGTADRPGVRYGSVITWSERPNLKGRLKVGLDPYAQVTHSLYNWLYRAAARIPPTKITGTARQYASALRLGYRRMPTGRDADGIVPTLSQPYGEIIATARADHLDVVGHFKDPDHVPPHIDWLASGTGFRRPDFEAIWFQVCQFIAGAAATEP